MTQNEITIKVLNAAGRCISWRTGSASQKNALLQQLQELFSGPDFSFVESPVPPAIPEGGYDHAEIKARRIRFTQPVS